MTLGKPAKQTASELGAPEWLVVPELHLLFKSTSKLYISI